MVTYLDLVWLPLLPGREWILSRLYRILVGIGRYIGCLSSLFCCVFVYHWRSILLVYIYHLKV